MSKNQITIGLMAQYAADAMRAPIVEAFCDTGTEEGVHTVLFLPHGYDEGHGSRRDVLRMVTPQNVDGLIVATPSSKVRQFAEEITDGGDSMPILAISATSSTLPAVRSDRDNALRMALEHLLDRHGYRRIGVVPDRKVDIQIVREMLETYGLTLDPSMELPRDSRRAAAALKSRRGLSRPQAVVTGTGVLGRRLVANLQGVGVLVPHDIAVIAADSVMAEQPLPALTTCGASSYVLARHATRAMIDHIRNGTPLESHLCPVQLSLQESCGCNRLHVCRDPSGDLNSIKDRVIALAAEDDAISLGLGLSVAGPAWVGKAFDALVSDVDTAQKDFSVVFDKMLNHPRRVENRDVSVRRVLWLLERELFATVDPDSKPGQRSRRILRRAWEALGAGRGLEGIPTGFHASRAQRDKCFRAFRNMTYQPDWEGLLGAVESGAEFIGIDRMYICLRRDPGKSPGPEDIMLALDEGKRIPVPDDLEFDPTVEVFPRGLFGDTPPEPCTVLSLYDHWENAYHGFVVIAGQHSGLALETMREALSNGFATAITHRAEVAALASVRTLQGLIPVCASCKKMRDDKGYWQQLEQYISDKSEARLTHSYCPECMQRMLAEAENVVVRQRAQ